MTQTQTLMMAALLVLPFVFNAVACVRLAWKAA